MRIASIKEIKNVGTFANFADGANKRFEDLTFIYGFNTYGKTTLTDIFQSLKNNDPQVLLNRKTIPTQTGRQKITLSVKDTNESDVKFENDQWTAHPISEYIEVFGTEFIYKNVFTGFNVERANKEQFTQFILGEQGVSLASEIKKNRQFQSEMSKQLKQLVPSYVKDKSDNDIDSFLKYDISKFDSSALDNDLTKKKYELSELKKSIENPQAILGIKSHEEYEVPEIGLIAAVESINKLLKSTYSDMNASILDQLSKHMSETHRTCEINSEKWLQQGLELCVDKENGNCPFCGQELQNAQTLLNLYSLYFQQGYSDYIIKLQGQLEKEEDLLTQQLANKTQLQTFYATLNKYSSILNNAEFSDKLKELLSEIESIQEEEVNSNLALIHEKAKSLIADKMKYPFKEQGCVKYKAFEVCLSRYEELLAKSKDHIDKLLLKITECKTHYKNITALNPKVQSLEQEIIDLNYKFERIKADEDCKKYAKARSELAALEKIIKSSQEQLQTEQSEYLKKYFVEINTLFKKFGSDKFELENEVSNRGHAPVYSFKVKFHNVEISNDKFSTLFSESDRRALALAIFLAKIKTKSDAESQKAVIVFDDPVTSFDDNRVTNSINEFKELKNKVSQIIILTHYPHFIKRFCDVTKDSQITTKYLEILKDSATSKLSVSNREKYTQSDFERIFIKIYDFINRNSSESIKTDLRPFLEDLYLKTVFAKTIHDQQVDLSGLDKMIDGIFDGNEDVKKRLHEFRKTLNPDSHLFTSNNDEDVRNFAKDMMNYLFSISF